MDVLERETIVEGPLAAQARLHAVPPAVVGAGETDDQFLRVLKRAMRTAAMTASVPLM